MRNILILIAAIAVASSLGCSGKKTKKDPYQQPRISNLPFVYKMTVQQGNIITEDMIDQLEIGMTKSQARYALGTPLLTDMFHTDRWDYTYTIRRGHKSMDVKRLTLWFQDDALTSIQGDMRPNPSRALAAEENREIVVKVPDWKNRRGLFNRTRNALGMEPRD